MPACRLSRLAKLLFAVVCINRLLHAAPETAPAPAASPAVTMLSEPVGATGTLRFDIQTDKPYRNGRDGEDFHQTLVTLDGLASCDITRSRSTVDLAFRWVHGGYDRGVHVNLVELPGPETYSLQFTWDAARGRCDGYLNGVPLALADTQYKPWTIADRATRFSIDPGPIRVLNLHVDNRYTLPEQIAHAMAQRPELSGRHKELLGYQDPPPPMNLDQRRGELLYQTPFDTPQSLQGWVMEGPGAVVFVDGGMRLSTDSEKAGGRNPGHFVYWCPKEFPDRFVAEWEYAPRSEFGLAIVFLAARGNKGEDLFDPSLPTRNGIFGQYTNGAIACYHISYLANLELYQTGRPCSNLRKNPGSMATAQGPIAIPSGAQGFQKMRLIKDGPHLQLQANNKVSIDWTDQDPARYGPAYGAGKLGLRQMAGTLGDYRALRVWALRPQ